MVLLVQKLTQFLKPHHNLDHNRPSAAAAGDFRSRVSTILTQIATTSESELWDLKKIRSCLETLSQIHKEFVKTVSDLNHPVSLWSHGVAEEYLSFSFDLLGLLNCVSSGVSHLNQAKLSLSHGLNLRSIKPLDLQKDFRISEDEKQGSEKTQKSSNLYDEKERAILEFLQITKNVAFWVLGVVISALCSDPRAYSELRKSAVDEPLLQGLDSEFYRGITEVREINAIVENGDFDAEEMGKKLEMFEENLEGMRKLTDCLFAEVLAVRNRLVDGIRCSIGSSSSSSCG